MRVLLALSTGVFMVPGGALAGQDVCEIEALDAHLAAERSLADKYAPFYWFAPGELYYPIDPLWGAFDGIDNTWKGDNLRDRNPGLIDLEDPGELHWANWDELFDAWQKELFTGTMPGTPERERAWQQWATTFYRLREVSDRERDELLYYLQSDEQSWSRFLGVAESEDRDPNDRAWIQDLTRTDFLSLEFYSYYVRDLGLEGHRWDLELAQVIMPADTIRDPDILIYVGAGHTQSVPNNVLVEHKYGDRPRSRRMHLLVELWDHSNATDRKPFGVFNFTPDVNWHARASWGVRDVQARYGTAATGEWDTWMASTRGQNTIVYVPPTASQEERDEYVVGDPRDARPTQVEYRLKSATLFDCLFREIEAASPSVDRLDEYTARVADQLGAPQARFAALDEARLQLAIDTLRHFSREGLRGPRGSRARGSRRRPDSDLGPEKLLPWESPHYDERPTRTLKTHLFRPVWGAQERLTHWGALFKPVLTGYPASAAAWQVGWEVPAFNFPIHIPGYLELQIGALCVQFDCFGGKTSLLLSLMHTANYRALATWYTRVSYAPDLDRVMPGPDDLGSVLAGGGVSLRIAPVRIRIGLATDVRSIGPRFENTWFEVILSPSHIRF